MCKMCNISELLIDKDYPICYRFYLYYEANNPKVLKDLEEGSIVKVEIIQILVSTVMMIM